MSCRCGNVAAILELDENLNKQFRVFDAAPQVCTSIICQMQNLDDLIGNLVFACEKMLPFALYFWLSMLILFKILIY